MPLGAGSGDDDSATKAMAAPAAAVVNEPTPIPPAPVAPPAASTTSASQTLVVAPRNTAAESDAGMGAAGLSSKVAAYVQLVKPGEVGSNEMRAIISSAVQPAGIANKSSQPGSPTSHTFIL